MAEYNYPSEDELLPNSTYNYDLIPTEQDGSINYTPGVYDQFISLRDTLIYSGKKYNGKAGAKLCVGEKEETVEVILHNLFQQNFETITDANASLTQFGPYVKRDSEVASIYGPMSCVIQKDGRYKIIHKEEVLPVAGSKKVYCYVDIYRLNDQGVYELPYKGGVAVFDWQGEFEKTFSGSTSGTDPNGSCSVKVSFKMGDIFQKVTAFGYMERNLLKGDILVLRAKDDETDPSTGEPQGNDLAFQTSSNYWSIEYLNLPIN